MLVGNQREAKFKTKKAWIKGKIDNVGQIPTEIAYIEDVLFVANKLCYKACYENGHVLYIEVSELDYCEIFKLEDVLK